MITNEDTFRSYPSKIEEIYNNWPKVTGEGSNISLSPVRKGKLLTELYGDTFQQTYTGKNLVDLSPLTQDKFISAASSQFIAEWVYDDEIGREVFHIQRTSYSTSYPCAMFQIPVSRFNPTGKNYAIIYKYKTNGNISDGTGYGCWISFDGRNNWETVGINSASVKNLYVKKSENWNIGVMRISKNNDEYDRFTNSYTTMNICLGTTGLDIGIYVSDIMVVEITDEQYNDTNYYPTGLSLEFEPYTGSTIGNITPSPNPDYPQDIQCVEGIQKVTVSGENKFNTDNISDSNANYTIIDKNSFSLNNIASSWKYVTFKIENLKKNTNYIIKANIEKETEDSGRIYTVVCILPNSETGKIKEQYGIDTGITFNSGNYETLYFKICNNTAFPNNIYTISNIQLEEGSQATTYQPYQSQTVQIDLGNIKMYDGDKFVGYTDNWSIVRNNGVIDSYSGETITTDYVSTTGGLDTGATIVYELDTPTTTPITDTTLIGQLNALYNAKSYNGQTNITVTSENLPLIISATALMKGSE